MEANNILLNDEWFNHEIKKEMKNYLEKMKQPQT